MRYYGSPHDRDSGNATSQIEDMYYRLVISPRRAVKKVFRDHGYEEAKKVGLSLSRKLELKIEDKVVETGPRGKIEATFHPSMSEAEKILTRRIWELCPK